MFDWIQDQALTGSLKDIKRVVPKPQLCCLGFVLRGIILLEGEPPSQMKYLSDLEKLFIKDNVVFCCVQLSLYPD